MTDFLILGGGCFGSFYTRQLLRGGDRVGLGKIRIVDKDPRCRAALEFGSSGDIEFHFGDWKPFLTGYFRNVLDRRWRGEAIHDQYVPPTFAPHVLMELFLDIARMDFPKAVFEKQAFAENIGTPIDRALPAGTKALSFATWTCPAACIEPPTCPHTRGPKSWDMKEHLLGSSFSGVDSLHIFQCRHYAMGVGTIPMREVVEEYLQFQKIVRVPGTHRVAMATVSSCHGLIGTVEVKHG